ncbi:MAG: hypothetical protein MUF73_16070, partial [Rhodobacteraceae bacterium]|nr:hypothetical protein [Paracoccaceae bacterium]
FTVAPSTTPAEFSTVGGVVNLRPGRARDGIGGPIDVRTRVLFGQIPGEGAEIDVPGWDYLPTAPGYLTFEQTADNAIHEPVTARSILPIAQTYPVLAASEISTRLQAFCTFIDNFDAGFPSDMVWRPSNVVDPGDGTVGLRLLRNTGVGRKHTGASVQFGFKSAANPAVRANSARLFNIEWTWQLIDTRAPGLAKGYMQTAFTFTVPWDAPRREIDFEYNTRSGYMECTIHMAANGDGPGSVADGISIEPPPEAFTSMRRWSIVGNADRIEWLYEDQVCARYIRGIGFDSSVQAFTPRRGIGNSQYARLMPGDTFLHRRDQHWQVNAQNIFIQQWMTDTNPAWLGPNTVPLDHPPLRFSRIDATEFGPPNTALQAGDWTLAPGSAGRAIVTVGAYRPARFRPTHLEYSVNGGAWVRLPGQFGPQTITGLVSGPRQIRLRPVAETIATDPTVTASTFVMNADPSDAKIVTIL